MPFVVTKALLAFIVRKDFILVLLVILVHTLETFFDQYVAYKQDVEDQESWYDLLFRCWWIEFGRFCI